MKKRIVVLGSTGSIGRQVLEVVRAMPGKFEILALCAGSDAGLLRQQALEFRPQWLGLADPEEAADLAGLGARVEAGPEAASLLAALPQGDMVVNGVSGFAGLAPLLAALQAGKAVALANKESIVCGHGLVERALAAGKGRIIPVDSEQSALYQCLGGEDPARVKRLLLTASGGPFRTYTRAQLARVTVADALRHPTWRMGRKITVDSASLFNKGLEILEAAYLFHMPGSKIQVLIHPESIVHSLVEFVDGCQLAQLSAPDMRLPIQYALAEEAREAGPFGALDLARAGTLHFEAPDPERFVALPLAYEALEAGGALPIAYNGANEVAAALFLQGKLPFLEIGTLVAYAMERMGRGEPRDLQDICRLDAQARQLAREKAAQLASAWR